MRELTKSILRFSWAMPLYGLQQMVNVSLPSSGSNPLAKAAGSLDNLAEAARGELSGPVRQICDAGDRVQLGVVDLAFRLLPLEWLDPSNVMKMGASMMGGSGCGCGPASPGGGPTAQGGWGPMPKVGS